MSGLIALGAAVAVITGIGAGLGIGMATSKAVEATAIYGFVIGLLIILFLK